MFGLGLGHKVRQAYRFLSFHYEQDDEIYVFGFSRGAFTARSLVGYVDHFSSHSGDDRALDDISFDWMVKRITHFTDLPLDPTQCKTIDAGWAACAQHDSFIGFYRLFRPVARSIANTEHTAGGKECTGYDRLADAIGEMIHRSALERLGRQNVGPHTARGYSPPNVLAVLDTIEATYGPRRQNAPRKKLLVVNWDGQVMSAEDDARRAEEMSLIGTARDRLSPGKP